ncbi:unnamed protein product [Onchocerca flexuosa]|uniref:DNA-binding protein n=1 Tax=Onchocerca flexuosa TaxID=387005 RepID=A0A183H052_9BILA|nr:unnamed protein product [Onchocerca flexuosa]
MVHFSTIQEFFKTTAERMKDNRHAIQEEMSGPKCVAIPATR